MKKQIRKRWVSFALIFSISVSLLSGFSFPAYAVIIDPTAAASFNADFNNAAKAASGLDQWVNAATAIEWPYGDELVDYNALWDTWVWYNGDLKNGGFRGALLNRYPAFLSVIQAIEKASANLSGNPGLAHLPYELQAELVQDPAQNNIWRLRTKGGTWIVDANGKYPYCGAAELNKQDVADAIEESSLNARYHDLVDNGKWISEPKAVKSRKVNITVDEAFFYRVAGGVIDGKANMSVSTTMINGVTYRCIAYYRSNQDERSIWCDSADKPFVTPYDKAGQAVTTPFDYGQIQETTNNQTEEIKDIVDEGVQQIINDAGTKLTIPLDILSGADIDLSLFKDLNIGDISFDFDNRSYTVNAYDVDYDITNNYYEFNYYTYNIQYTYNNTYVTYIGSTAEYQPKEWALYYELPDGRSSADLTEEDIAGLSFQFQDMVNYKRSATDTSLRALYHFDGNTEDSSYWSTQGAFTWNSGASITYMESNAFNGALYLDEKAHQFTITLPSSIGSQDFSLQWRYYQNSATTTDYNENYVTVGGTKLLGWSEQKLYNGSGTSIAGLSVGTWQELALIREKGTLYTYHNGVKVASASVPTVFNDKIVFYLGANSRAYSMMDELRVVNFAIAKSGASYTPTAVPHDTNSVLILPDGVQPVADEFWKWDTTIKPTYAWDLTSGYIDAPTYSSKSGSTTFWDIRSSLNSGSWIYTSNTVNVADGFISLVNSSSTVLSSNDNFTTSSSAQAAFKGSGIGLWVKTGNFNGKVPCTVTVVDRDMNRYSLTMNTGTARVTGQFEWGTMFFGQRFWSDYDDWSSECIVVLFDLNPNTTLDIVYVEVVPGEQPNTGHEFINAIYSSDELQPNTAAIQSTIPVKGYTVGGVRPTFPERGDVWMPVEGSRISGVYIYNGQAWEETNARYWTGKRWIPIYAFDLVTLADMWDVGSSTGGDVSPSISSEYGFWNWWKNAWNEFTAKLFPALGTGSGGGGSGSGTIPDDSLPGEGGEDDGWSVLDLLKALKDGAWAIVTGTVKVAFGGVVGIVTTVTTIGDFFTAAGDLSGNIEGGYESWVP